jgi:hypothetical protein
MVAAAFSVGDESNRTLAFVAFAGMVTTGGSNKSALVELRATEVGPEAAVVKLTVHVTGFPGVNFCGVQFRSSSAETAGVSQIEAEAELKPAVARKVKVFTVVGEPAVIVKFPASRPPATVTEEGALKSAPPSDEIPTEKPPGAAAVESVTVQVVLVFGVSVVLAHRNPLTPIDRIESDTDLAEAPRDAVSVAV